MEYTSDEDTVDTVEMIRDLGYYVDLIDKVQVGFERIDSNFERSSVGKMHIQQLQVLKKNLL